MKEFNLEHALAGAPVVTRDGREVTEFGYFKSVAEGNFCIVAVINEEMSTFTKFGAYTKSSISGFDLFMAPAFYLNDKEYYFDDAVMLKGQRTVVNAETVPEIKTALMYPDLIKPVARKKMWARMYTFKDGRVGIESWRDEQRHPSFPGSLIDTKWIGEPVSYEVEE